MGCTFFVCSQILAEGVCTAVDLNRGAKIGLRWRKGPVDIMRQFGESEVIRLVKDYVSKYNEISPEGITSENWKMEYVTLEYKQSYYNYVKARRHECLKRRSDVSIG